MSERPVAGATQEGQLTRLAAPLLSLLIVLRRSNDLDSFPDLMKTVDRLFQEFRHQARRENIPADEIDDASYALAASCDETMLSASWEGKAAWQQNNLARRYCNDEFVGDGFYDKLAEVRRALTPKRDVEEVFYYCLVSGFQGRLIESPRERDDLMSELSGDIGAATQVLAPHGLPHDQGGALAPIKRFPWPLVVLACVFIPIVFWLVSWNVLDRHADKIVQALGVN